MKNPDKDGAISMEMRFNKYEGGLENSEKSFGLNSMNSGLSGNQPLSFSMEGGSPTKTNILHQKALMNKSNNIPQMQSFKSTGTDQSMPSKVVVLDSKCQSPRLEDMAQSGGEKTSLHNLDGVENGDTDLGSQAKAKKASGFGVE
jgi:hypothetical protein